MECMYKLGSRHIDLLYDTPSKYLSWKRVDIYIYISFISWYYLFVFLFHYSFFLMFVHKYEFCNVTLQQISILLEAWRFRKYFTYKSILLKTFEGEMLIRSQTTTFLQIYCELSLCSHVIFKSMKIADDTF